jgi:hypothetical protein
MTSGTSIAVEELGGAAADGTDQRGSGGADRGAWAGRGIPRRAAVAGQAGSPAVRRGTAGADWSVARSAAARSDRVRAGRHRRAAGR